MISNIYCINTVIIFFIDTQLHKTLIQRFSFFLTYDVITATADGHLIPFEFQKIKRVKHPLRINKNVNQINLKKRRKSIKFGFAALTFIIE